MFPLLPIGPKEQPWHSSQYPTLPEVYVQNASLEIAWSRVIFENRTIAGDSYVPFITEGDEGYDVNDVADWIYAEYLRRQRRGVAAADLEVGVPRRGVAMLNRPRPEMELPWSDTATRGRGLKSTSTIVPSLRDSGYRIPCVPWTLRW